MALWLGLSLLDIVILKSDVLLEFDDVQKCSSVADFNLFVRRYLAERHLVANGVKSRKTYWALFYAWKNSLELVD
jgi:hypothetical protein